MKDMNKPIEKKADLPIEKGTSCAIPDELVIGSLHTSEFIRDDPSPIASPSMKKTVDDTKKEPDQSSDIEETFREGFYDVSNNLEIKMPTEPFDDRLDEAKPASEQMVHKSPTKVTATVNNLMKHDSDIPMKPAKPVDLDDEEFYQGPADPTENQFKEPILPLVDLKTKPLEDAKAMKAKDARVEEIFKKGLNDVPKAPYKEINKLPDEPEKPIQ